MLIPSNHLAPLYVASIVLDAAAGRLNCRAPLAETPAVGAEVPAARATARRCLPQAPATGHSSAGARAARAQAAGQASNSLDERIIDN